MSDAIRVESVGKRYVIGRSGTASYGALRDVLADGMRSFARRAARPVRRGPVERATRRETLWALEDVSFSVGRGERLGVIGRNGAGKSTLLKILSRITEPTTGRVRLRGRVASLLEVGTGFHPELTGRENIYLNGTILGMSRAEIRRKFDEIIAFAEIERFLDTPVKRYSSGMYVRLAFAVAAHLEPEILLVDEVLAVGDAAFQRKCLGKMSDVAESGRTILLVSHNMAAVTQLCSSAIWLDHGRLREAGPARDVIDAYTSSFTASADGQFVEREVRGDAAVELLSYRVTNAQGLTLPPPVTKQDLTLVVRVRVNQTIAQPACGINIYANNGVLLTSVNSVQTGQALAPWEPGERDVSIVLRRVPYLPGHYRAGFWAMSPHGHIYAHVEDAIQFEIGETPLYGTSRVTSPGYGQVYADVDFAPDPI